MAYKNRIYERYISGELDIKPDSFLQEIRTELAVVEKRLGLDFEQSEELKELMLNAASRYGKAMFRAGFELAAGEQLTFES